MKKITPSAVILFNWDDVMEAKSAGNYGIAAEDVEFGDAKQPLYTPTGVRCMASYRGVDQDGRNLGVTAVIVQKCTSHGRLGQFGEGATGDCPYFKKATGGLHRGHLLARSLGGRGDRLNWVPLKATANLDEWRLVESTVFNHLQNTRGAWAELAIVPVYGKHIPVPSEVHYTYILHVSNDATGPPQAMKKIVSNHLEKDAFTYGLLNNWKP